DVGLLSAQADPLVVVVYGDRKRALGVLLADHVAVQLFHDCPWRRVLGTFRRLLFGEDVVAQSHALIADEDARAGDELSDLAALLSAEGAVELFHPAPILTCLGARAIARIAGNVRLAIGGPTT